MIKKNDTKRTLFYTLHKNVQKTCHNFFCSFDFLNIGSSSFRSVFFTISFSIYKVPKPTTSAKIIATNPPLFNNNNKFAYRQLKVPIHEIVCSPREVLAYCHTVHFTIHTTPSIVGRYYKAKDTNMRVFPSAFLSTFRCLLYFYFLFIQFSYHHRQSSSLSIG